MSQFKYLTPMERPYYNEPQQTSQATGGMGIPGSLEEPIIPVGEIGVTVPETDPRTGAHILQNVQAAIHGGSKNIQLIMMTPSNNPIGGRPKAYGKEVRQAIKEVANASKVMIRGLEMPTSSISNLSGFDPSRGTISDQKREEDMDEVRDAIKFVADVAGGGAVDIWSQEFPRTIFDMDTKLNPTLGRTPDGKEIKMFKEFEKEDELAVKHLVDARSGRVIQEIRMNQQVAYPEWETVRKGEKYFDTEKNQWITADAETFVDLEKRKVPLGKRVPKWDPENETFVIKPKKWEDFEKEAKVLTEIRKQDKEGRGEKFDPEQDTVKPHEAVFIATTMAQEAVARGWALHYQEEIEKMRTQLEKLKKAQGVFERIEKAASPEEREFLKREADAFSDLIPPDVKDKSEIAKDQIRRLRHALESNTELAKGQLQQAEDLKLQADNIVSADKYAKEKAIDSYAEMGLFAFKETQNRGFRTKPLSVGPELGWPSGWGGHPLEFKELIVKAREKMIERLQKEEGLSKEDANHAAKESIKGCFDTGHLGMWLSKFRRIPGESEKERLNSFNKWFMEMSDELAKSGVVGSIQAVDSMSGAHGHLPAGQGIFPIKDAVKKFKQYSWTGWIVSEGHEEEKFGENRMLFKTWENFGSPIYQTGLYGFPQTWGSIQQGYFGNQYPPYFVTQAYVPINDFKLWSEVVLE